MMDIELLVISFKYAVMLVVGLVLIALYGSTALKLLDEKRWEGVAMALLFAVAVAIAIALQPVFTRVPVSL